MVSTGEPLHRDGSASAANWQDPPFNRWAFWHVRELLPTQPVPRGRGPVRPLPEALGEHDVPGVEMTRVDGARATVGDVLADTFTDAYAVLQDGRLVAEEYAPTGGPRQTHAVLSITKSVVCCVAAILADRGQLDVSRDVVDYVPELAESGYAGATVQHLLGHAQRRALPRGVRRPGGRGPPARRMDRRRSAPARGAGPGAVPVPPAAGGRGAARQPLPLPLRRHRRTGLGVRAGRGRTDGRPGQRPGVGADGRGVRRRDHLRRPGTAIHDGGLAATARDLLRFGQMLLDGGVVPDKDGERQPGPSYPPAGCAGLGRRLRQPQPFLDSPAERAFPGGWYRHGFWFRPGEHGDVLLGLGIHGQMLHVSRRTGTVCVKLSSWPDPSNPAFLQDTLRAFDAVGGAMRHRPSAGEQRRLPGVSGVGHGRRGGGSRPSLRATSRPYWGGRHEPGDAQRHRRDPLVLPHQHAADLLRRPDRVQPAGHRPVGPQLPVPRLLRLLGRRAPPRVRAVQPALRRVRVERADQQLPAARPGGAGPPAQARWSARRS